MRTGLFFGTFNPVHRGHEALVESFLNSECIEDLWVILTPNPPHKHISSLASFQDRWNMLELAFGGRSDLKLSDVEQRMNPPNYTLKTLSFLTTSFPDHDFMLCIGSDTLQDLPKWYEFEKISQKAKLLVAERPDTDTSIPTELGSFDVHFCEHEKVNISSTGIRKLLMESGELLSDHLHPEVEAYIRRRGLYKKE